MLYAGSSGDTRFGDVLEITNGYLYGIPHKSAQVLRFNPNTDTGELLGTDLGTAASKWSSGAISGSDNTIVGIPYDSEKLLTINADTTSAVAPLTFTAAGTYKLCYRPSGGAYQAVGSSTIVVKGPTSWSGTFFSGMAADLTFTGTGVNLAANQDKFKAKSHLITHPT